MELPPLGGLLLGVGNAQVGLSGPGEKKKKNVLANGTTHRVVACEFGAAAVELAKIFIESLEREDSWSCKECSGNVLE